MACPESSKSWCDGFLFPLPDNDTIYWVDMGLSTISRAKRDQTWREDVVTNGIGRVEGIAVDWIAGVWHRNTHTHTHSGITMFIDIYVKDQTLTSGR